MSRRELWDLISDAAAQAYEPREARAVTALLCESLFGMRFTDVVVEPGAPYPLSDQALLERVTRELAAGRPVQYIVGSAEFCGLDLALREGVLIPRPETGELVRWILSEKSSAKSLLDIGTGSGAIALALKAGLPGASVTAVDISPEALAIARENARRNKLQVEFLELNILSDFPTGTYDVIVSNPPYVTHSEKVLMAPNVLQYEPHQALFVEDDDPLIFYRAIAQKARQALVPGGSLYFEINEQFGPETAQLLKSLDYREVEVRKDLFEKPRMVRAKTPQA